MPDHNEPNQFVQPLVYPGERLSAKIRKAGLRRAAFCAMYYGVARYLPSVPGVGVLGALLRRACAKRMLRRCGSGVRIGRGATFGDGSKVSLGDNASISQDSWILGDVTIGNDVMMAPEVVILTYNHRFDRTDIPMIEQGVTEISPVVIGDDVWVGTRVVIMPGVRVGSHTILAAAAVVTKDVPDWAIVGGNPARVIRYRNAPQASDVH